jgi:uncharacterized protein
MTIENQQIILSAEEFVKQKLSAAEAGHDWWHVVRVRNLCRQILLQEKGDAFIIELAALLHDIADAKFNGGDENEGPLMAREFLLKQGVEVAVADHVVQIISGISFRNDHKDFKSPELAVVQDADRLDAMGAIGIARAFHYGGFKNRIMYDPSIELKSNLTKEEYRKSSSPTINHFYEKLLKLKDGMNTPTGKLMAEQRHEFMELYLQQFFVEWEGRSELKN